MSMLLPAVEAALETNHISYRVLDCDPALADTAAFCEHYGFSLDQSANTIMVASKSEPVTYACCVVLATAKLDINKMVRQLLGARKVSFAPMDKALELSGMEYGGVMVFGLPANVAVYVDSAVLRQSQIVMGGGNRTSKVLLNPEELIKLPNLQVIDSLAIAKS